MITRESLTWALNAAIPHAGKLQATNVVALESVQDGDERALAVYGTDRYTFGVAYVWQHNLDDVYAPLSRREATELLRFVRPDKVAEQKQEVKLLSPGSGDLHVGIRDDGGIVDSAVFELREAEFVHQDLSDLFGRLWNLQPARLTRFNPELLARFAKVSRGDTDRMEFRPVYRDKTGGMAVAMQEHFIGGIAGMSESVPSLDTKDEAA